MATDTTALTEAIRAMGAAVAHGDVMDAAHRRCPTSASEGRLLQAAGHELVAGRALLAALEGEAGEWEQVRTQNADLREFIRSQDARIAALEVVATISGTPERLALLETLYAHAWNFNDMHDDFTAALAALAVLDGGGPG